MAATSAYPISAVIPTVGRATALELCLESILIQTCPVAEVIVVHCGTDAETPALLEDPKWRRRGLDCRYLLSGVRNPAKQRNFGVKLAKFDNLLLLDDDVELEPDWAAELFRPIWNDARVAATMGRIVNQPMASPTPVWCWYRRLVCQNRKAFEPGRLIGAVIPNGFPLEAASPMPTEWLGGGVTAVRRDAFDSVGGFATYFSDSSPGEDLDLGYRLSRQWKVLYVPSARCLHHQDPVGRATLAVHQQSSVRSRYATLRRAFRYSAVGALAHVACWILFQSLSEVLALRKSLSLRFLAGWYGRLMGFISCIGWEPQQSGDSSRETKVIDC